MIIGYVLMNVDVSFPRILMTQLTAMMSHCRTWSHRPACIRIIALKYCLLYCISTPRTTLCARIINFVVKKKNVLYAVYWREKLKSFQYVQFPNHVGVCERLQIRRPCRSSYAVVRESQRGKRLVRSLLGVVS